MSYKRAEEILPIDLIEIIQNYVDGENIYIPRKKNERNTWGEKTKIRQELQTRNLRIWKDAQEGVRTQELANKYFLSSKSIQRILRDMRKEVNKEYSA